MAAVEGRRPFILGVHQREGRANFVTQMGAAQERVHQQDPAESAAPGFPRHRETSDEKGGHVRMEGELPATSAGSFWNRAEEALIVSYPATTSAPSGEAT